MPRGHPHWLLLPFLLSSLLCVCPSSLSAHPGSWLKTAISIFIPPPDIAHELDTQVHHPAETVSNKHLSKIKFLLSLKLSLPQCSPPQVRATLDCRLPGHSQVFLSHLGELPHLSSYCHSLPIGFSPFPQHSLQRDPLQIPMVCSCLCHKSRWPRAKASLNGVYEGLRDWPLLTSSTTCFPNPTHCLPVAHRLPSGPCSCHPGLIQALFRSHFHLEALIDHSAPILSLSTNLTGLVFSCTSLFAFVSPAMIVGTCMSVPC